MGVKNDDEVGSDPAAVRPRVTHQERLNLTMRPLGNHNLAVSVLSSPGALH